MYNYQAYGLTIASEVPLGIRESKGGLPDISIQVEAPPPNGKLGDYGVDFHVVKVLDRMTCCLQNGNTIRIIPNPKYFDELERVVDLVFDVLLAGILQQRGMIVLHAATLQWEGHTVALLGDRGAGKSTTAAYLLNNGFILLDDDLMVTDLSSKPFRVYSGSTQIRLRPSSAEIIGDGFSDLPVAHPYESKRLLSVDQVVSDVELEPASLFILKWSENDTPPAVSQMSKSQAHLALMMNTYIAKLDVIPEQKRNSFDRCKTLLSSVSVFELTRPRTLASLPLVQEAICSALGQASTLPSQINNDSDTTSL